MIRNLKILGLAAMAVLAISAMSAAAAQAAPEGHCEVATGESCWLHGKETNHVFTLTPSGATVKCTTSTTFTATVSKTFTEAIFSPTYEGCKTAGVKTTIDVNGCTFRVKLTAGGTSPFPTTTSLVCPANKRIEITPTGVNCVIHVEGSGQNPEHNQNLEGLTLKNEGSGSTRDLLANIDVTKSIHYVVTGTECPEAAGTYTEGDYTGTLTLSAFKDVAGVKGVQVGLWVE